MSDVASAIGLGSSDQLIFVVFALIGIGGGMVLLAFLIHLHRPRFPTRHKIIPIDRDIAELWARQMHSRQPYVPEERKAA